MHIPPAAPPQTDYGATDQSFGSCWPRIFAAASNAGKAPAFSPRAALLVRVAGRGTARPYSIARPAPLRYLGFTLKLAANGVSPARRRCETGDTLLFGPKASGHFPYDPACRTRLADARQFGTGLAPLQAIARGTFSGPMKHLSFLWPGRARLRLLICRSHCKRTRRCASRAWTLHLRPGLN